MKLGDDNDVVKPQVKKVKSDYANSKLPDSVQELMKFIYDTNLINKTVEQSGYDIKKLPLGQLSDETIKNGYQMLKKIETVLNEIKSGNKSRESTLADLSSKFYTYIPHNFGRQKMSNFIINTFPDLNKKLELLQNLDDSKTAIKIQNDTNAKID